MRELVELEENATPSQLARSWQGTGKYIAIDEYVDITIHKETILYSGEPNETEYFTTMDAIEQSGRDVANEFEGLQVEKIQYMVIEEKCKGIFSMKMLRVLMI